MPTMRRATLAVLALITLAGCGRKGARGSDFDSATAAALASGGGAAAAAAAASQPRVAHINGFNIGHSLDKNDMIFGGPSARFSQGDSVLLSVQTEYAPAGTAISARIRLKNATLDSAGALSRAPDTLSTSYVGLRFASTKKWAKGTYQADVFLNGKFQMSQDFLIVQ
jgi:hypothetical protein